MKPSQSHIIEKLKKVEGDAATVADAIAELEPDLDDPIVAERVRETLHRAATGPRRPAPREPNDEKDE